MNFCRNNFPAKHTAFVLNMYYQTLTTKMFSLATTRRMMLARRNYCYASSFHASAAGKRKTSSSSSSFSALNDNDENNVVVLVEDDDYDDDARRESSSSSSSSNNTNNNGHIVLVDGMSFLFRAFYGFQARSDATKLINSKGEDVGVLHAYAHAMCALLESKPSHFAVCFDSKGKTFRHEMFVDYKANRPPTPEALIALIPKVSELVEGDGHRDGESERGSGRYHRDVSDAVGDGERV